MIATIWQDISFALRSFTNPARVHGSGCRIDCTGNRREHHGVHHGRYLPLGQMPVRDPAQIVSLAEGHTLSWPDYLDYRAQTKPVFQGVSAHFPMVPAS